MCVAQISALSLRTIFDLPLTSDNGPPEEGDRSSDAIRESSGTEPVPCRCSFQGSPGCRDVTDIRIFSLRTRVLGIYYVL